MLQQAMMGVIGQSGASVAPTVPLTNLVHERLMDGDLLDTAGSMDLSGTNISYSTPVGVLQDVAQFDTTAYTDDSKISTLYATSDYTISLVFKINAYDVETKVLMAQTNANYDRFSIAIRTNGTLAFGHYTGTFQAVSTQVGSFTDTTNYKHLLVSRTSAGVSTMYLNNIAQTGAESGGTNIASGFNIGSLTSLNNRLDGDIARVRIYNAILGPTDRNNLYQDAQHRLNVQ